MSDPYRSYPAGSFHECVGIHGDAIKIRVVAYRSMAQPTTN
jgi:hypothetical protein